MSAFHTRLLLYKLQSPINIGMILRVAETFQLGVVILDPRGVMGDPAKASTISDFACGALQRQPPLVLASEADLPAVLAQGRVIATTIDQADAPLPDFRWRANDLIVLGNEYDGLPADLVAGADARLTIPMPKVWTPKPKSNAPIDPSRSGVSRDGQPNLNVALSAGILCYTAYRASVSA